MLNNIAALLGGAAPEVGDYESIATTTVGGGGVADITFSSIPSTYKHLQIRFIARTTRAFAGDLLALQFNGDTASNYAFHLLTGNGASASAGATTSTTNIVAGRLSGATANANTFGTGVIDILDYANSNKYRTTRSLTGQDNNGSGFITLYSGLYQSATAVNSIRFFSSLGANDFVQYSSFALYGIK